MMKWLAILFTVFVVLIIVLADTGHLGVFANLYRVPYADKVGHFSLYGILTLLIDLALLRSQPARRRKWIVLTSGLILAVLIGLEEVSQRNFSTRTFSLGDLSAGYLGVTFFSWLAWKRATDQ